MKVNYVDISRTFRSMLAKETLAGRNDLAFFSELFHSVHLAEPRSREGEREKEREREAELCAASMIPLLSR